MRVMKKYCRMDHRSIKRWSKWCWEGWARKIRPLNRLGLISVQRTWISGFWLSTVALFRGAVMLKSALQEFNHFVIAFGMFQEKKDKQHLLRAPQPQLVR